MSSTKIKKATKTDHQETGKKDHVALSAGGKPASCKDIKMERIYQTMNSVNTNTAPLSDWFYWTPVRNRKVGLNKNKIMRLLFERKR
ncbi:hypothetical protein [Sphingobacterium sp. JB170]|uniref:hypothetical protein n=1 Tax=Sphingobacterium sp. JB170 TaxID=1434842 RepID=UPI00097ED32C|nr:hypothetical protein [Sphingobacterium sp. JB170]SJN22630.1 hypothetical protein FM107_03435 [Sphingobacterium sp. JB170]